MNFKKQSPKATARILPQQDKQAMPYTQDYLALDALHSGAPDYGVQDIRAGEQLDYDLVICAESQCSLRKCLLATNRASQDEVKAAALRCDQLKSEFAVGGTTQVLEAIQTLHKIVRDEIGAVRDEIRLVRDEIRVVKAHQDYQDATSYNRRYARSRESHIQEVPHKQSGVLPATVNVWFPQTLGGLTSATNPNINHLCTFYGLQDNHLQSEKRDALERFLGIKH